MVQQSRCLIRLITKKLTLKQVTLITTLLDIQLYPTLELVKIYELRWDVELDLKHIKTTLEMDILRGKTPEMVRKEIYVHLLAYNLLRTVMWQAGKQKEVNPLGISLQGTRHHLNNFISELKDATSINRKRLYQIMLKLIAHKLLPSRPARVEPRVRKRRPKSYPLMQQPRQLYNQQAA